MCDEIHLGCVILLKLKGTKGIRVGKGRRVAPPPSERPRCGRGRSCDHVRTSADRCIGEARHTKRGLHHVGEAPPTNRGMRHVDVRCCSSASASSSSGSHVPATPCKPHRTSHAVPATPYQPRRASLAVPPLPCCPRCATPLVFLNTIIVRGLRRPANNTRGKPQY